MKRRNIISWKMISTAKSKANTYSVNGIAFPSPASQHSTHQPLSLLFKSFIFSSIIYSLNTTTRGMYTKKDTDIPAPLTCHIVRLMLDRAGFII